MTKGTAAARIGLTIVAAVLLFTLYPLFFRVRPGGYLLVSDDRTGRERLRLPLSPSEEFSITFVHSVNNTPITDVFDVTPAGLVRLRRTVYYDFGAGVPFDLNPGESFSYAEDGAMIISGIDREVPRFVLFVGTVSDHTLTVGGRTFSLRDICGRNARVHIHWAGQ